MGRENYAVARTDRTLIVADLKRGLVSEVSWKEPEVVQVLKHLINREKKLFILMKLHYFSPLQDGNKTKFHFDTPHACMVFSRGELTLIEYGVNSVLERLRSLNH